MSPRLAAPVEAVAPVTVSELLRTVKSGRVLMLLVMVLDMSLMFSLGSPATTT